VGAVGERLPLSSVEQDEGGSLGRPATGCKICNMPAVKGFKHLLYLGLLLRANHHDCCASAPPAARRRCRCAAEMRSAAPAAAAFAGSSAAQGALSTCGG